MWVLNKTIPDIYTDDTVQGNLHTCFEAPYPSAYWYVNQSGNDIVHMGEIMEWHTPCFEAPYPSIFWHLENNDVIHSGELDYVEMGAFKDCSNLTSAVIPTTVKNIGIDAFIGTAIEQVIIASDCIYSPSSFPEGCDIIFAG